LSGWVGGTGGKEDEKVSERRRLEERERCVLERLDEREPEYERGKFTISRRIKDGREETMRRREETHRLEGFA